MALIITEECINCTACEEQCPNHAITQADIYVIDAAKCTECVGYEESPQCIPVCPVDCIQVDPAHTEDLAALRAKYEQLHGSACPDIGKGFVAV